jgi:hypothetical protein
MIQYPFSHNDYVFLEMEPVSAKSADERGLSEWGFRCGIFCSHSDIAKRPDKIGHQNVV